MQQQAILEPQAAQAAGGIDKSRELKGPSSSSQGAQLCVLHVWQQPCNMRDCTGLDCKTSGSLTAWGHHSPNCQPQSHQLQVRHQL